MIPHDAFCTIKKVECRHCSLAIYTHIKREGHILDKNFRKHIEKIELGLFCNNVSEWIDKMKVCPMDTSIKLKDIPEDTIRDRHKVMVKFWKKGGINVSKL